MTFAYDDNGNMTDGGGRSYLYDGENRPVEIGGVSFAYGPDGARWKKSIDNGRKGKKKGRIPTPFWNPSQKVRSGLRAPRATTGWQSGGEFRTLGPPRPRPGAARLGAGPSAGGAVFSRQGGLPRDASCS